MMYAYRYLLQDRLLLGSYVWPYKPALPGVIQSVGSYFPIVLL